MSYTYVVGLSLYCFAIYYFINLSLYCFTDSSIHQSIEASNPQFAQMYNSNGSCPSNGSDFHLYGKNPSGILSLHDLHPQNCGYPHFGQMKVLYGLSVLAVLGHAGLNDCLSHI